jgi:DNA-binding beta-propeller fold protein YncE
VDANFNAGVDYCPVNDKIYIGRQGFTNPADQLVRVFDGTALTPFVDINIATLQPYDLIYCSDFNVICVGCQDYTTTDNAVLIIDCATNTVIGNVTIPAGQAPSTVGYNSQTKQLFADTGVFIYVIDIPTASITCTVPVVSQPLSYAFNTSNNKMYRPQVGTLIIDTLQ